MLSGKPIIVNDIECSVAGINIKKGIAFIASDDGTHIYCLLNPLTEASKNFVENFYGEGYNDLVMKNINTQMLIYERQFYRILKGIMRGKIEIHSENVVDTDKEDNEIEKFCPIK